MKFYPSLFFKEALLFGATLALGIFVSFQYTGALSQVPRIEPSAIRPVDFVGFFIVLAAIWVGSRVPRFARWLFWTFLSLLIVSGTQIVALPFVPSPWDMGFAVGLFILFLTLKNVLIHNIAIIFAIAGVGAFIGLEITPSMAILAFVFLSFYDIIAVYKTRHMVHMAEGMIRSGAIFGFIIPATFKLFFASREEAQARVGDDFMILGSGDIGLPVIFVSSLVRQSLIEAIIVAIAAMVGLLLTHLLFMSQTKRQPMAALPPIATMTILGYVLSLLLRF